MHDAKFLARLAQVRLLFLDVDGTLTDGGIFLGEKDEYKRFDVQDGAGIVLLQQAGIKTVVCSGRKSACVDRRCRELHIDEVYQGADNKMAIFEEVLKRHSLEPQEVAVMGDDLADLALMMRAGVSAAPSNASREVRIRAGVVTHARGGEGAVREFAELLLKAQDKWPDILERYLA